MHAEGGGAFNDDGAPTTEHAYHAMLCGRGLATLFPPEHSKWCLARPIFWSRDIMSTTTIHDDKLVANLVTTQSDAKYARKHHITRRERATNRHSLGSSSIGNKYSLMNRGRRCGYAWKIVEGAFYQIPGAIMRRAESGRRTDSSYLRLS